MPRPEIAWLLEKLKISRERITTDDAFDERLKVQKAAFLLHYLGIEPFKNYSFNMYLKGPYSSELASEYYDSKLNSVAPAHLEIGDEKERLLSWFTSNDPSWMEVASSILLLSDRSRNLREGEIYDILRISKPWVSREFCLKIYNELKARGLL
jgi:hypothetical protein